MIRIRMTSAALASVVVLGGLGVAYAATTTTTTSTTTDMVGCLSSSGNLSSVSQSTTLPTCSNGKAVGWNAKGIQGPPGLVGKDGPPGLDGKQGPNGNDGKSAYDLYVDAYKAAHPGATGGWHSLIDWIASLKGQDGTNGRNGVAGATLRPVAHGSFATDAKTATATADCTGTDIPLSGGFKLDTSLVTNNQWPAVVENGPVQHDGVWGWRVTVAAPSGNSSLAVPFDVTVVCAPNAN